MFSNELKRFVSFCEYIYFKQGIYFKNNKSRLKSWQTIPDQAKVLNCWMVKWHKICGSTRVTGEAKQERTSVNAAVNEN